MTDVTKRDAAVEGVPVDGCADAGTGAGVQAAASAGKSVAAMVNRAVDAPVVQIRGLHKAYGGNEVLRGIGLDVHRGEVVVVLGPSGSGKSTMLRCVNLLETPTAGSIVVEGVDITGKGVDINKVARPWAWCFSSSTCFRTSRRKRT